MNRNPYDPGPSSALAAALVAGFVVLLVGAALAGGWGLRGFWVLINGGQW